ncbi:hypothetical protein GGI42DRAFT_41187 [Trichoderma sp. SZMC 28013]
MHVYVHTAMEQYVWPASPFDACTPASTTALSAHLRVSYRTSSTSIARPYSQENHIHIPGDLKTMDPFSIANLTISVLDQLWRLGETTAELVANYRDFDEQGFGVQGQGRK